MTTQCPGGCRTRVKVIRQFTSKCTSHVLVYQADHVFEKLEGRDSVCVPLVFAIVRARVVALLGILTLRSVEGSVREPELQRQAGSVDAPVSYNAVEGDLEISWFDFVVDRKAQSEHSGGKCQPFTNGTRTATVTKSGMQQCCLDED